VSRTSGRHGTDRRRACKDATRSAGAIGARSLPGGRGDDFASALLRREASRLGRQGPGTGTVLLLFFSPLMDSRPTPGVRSGGFQPGKSAGLPAEDGIPSVLPGKGKSHRHVPTKLWPLALCSANHWEDHGQAGMPAISRLEPALNEPRLGRLLRRKES